MESTALLAVIASESRALLMATESDWHRPITHCSKWDAAELTRHCGGIFGWMAAVVTSGDRVSRRTLEPPPEGTDELSAWYCSALDRVLDVFADADPEATTWTFSTTGDHRVAWWYRRLACEIAVHRSDAEQAVSVEGGPPAKPLDGELAAIGIEEYIVEFLPELLSGDSTLGGSLHLHATDGPLEWWIDLDAGGAPRKEHAKADTALQGTRSDLLLWLYNRTPSKPLEVFGNTAIQQRWGQLAF